MPGTQGPLNALLDLRQMPVANAELGPLAGLRLAVKDIGSVGGAPFGLSLLGPSGSDVALIRLGRRILDAARKV
ncbi:hypothetical protein RFM41_01595 [Mesorhizobium sp. VK25A]|uniref:Amidase domain-containing protein n=1 Tax=Mesorhizobium vachelliae TaxID=3072309 RepID=A0ABU4ZYD1_9HYPH|nr:MULTISPECIES: hypothetical protein [unclassified Mesorhizobium]MDX8530429.1 hypothetical protein [Mesorhizobium sp. VK25D]MDX8542406.1 hypothetical protein [Mesorhizobium sp. VK25A]